MAAITRRTLLVGMGATSLLAPRLANAQAGWPSKPITIITPANAGGQGDIFARVLTTPLQRSLGQPVIVENRGGAGGIIGTRAAVAAAADGHTLVYGSTSGFIIAPQMREPLPYHTPKDLAPVALTLGGPSIITVQPHLPINNAHELVAYLKANPGKLNLGSHGVGSFSHVAMEMFMAETGTSMAHIGFNGGGPLAQAFLAKTIDIVLFDVVSIAQQVEAGSARVVAQVGEQRSPLFPNIPLVSETVAPGVRADYWLGLFAPAATPAPILDRLHAEITGIMATDENRERVRKASMLTPTLSRAEFTAKIEREWVAWGKVIRDRRLGGIGAAK